MNATPALATSTTIPEGGRTQTILDLVPVLFVIVAEAAWISVLGGFVQEVRLQAPVIGIPFLIVTVGLGVAAARTIGTRIGRAWIIVGLGLSLAAGITGWLVDPAARAAVAAADLRTAIAINPGGWIAALAMLRGFANARFPLSDATCARMLRLGIPGVALVALLGGAVAEPWRDIFLADTLLAAVIFVACGTFALALARQRSVAADTYVDWRRNRAWLAVLVGSVAAGTAIALVMAGVVADAIPLLIGIALGPFLAIGLVFGTNRGTARIVALTVAGAIFIYVLVSAFTSADPDPAPATGSGTPPVTPDTDPGVIIGLGGLGAVVVVIAILILIRLWMGQMGPVEADPTETRTIDHGADPRARTPRSRRRRRSAPADAIGAYLALLEDVETRAPVRRLGSETPLEHARRLRMEGHGNLSMDLLAADYALVRFGGLALAPSEDRRAVLRWRVLRARLGRR